MTLHSGERQVSPTVGGIRRDHRARYEWAAKMLPPGSRVLDLACGIGYGAKILADAGHKVHAIDRDKQSIRFGGAHYAHDSICFECADAEEIAGIDDDAFDAVVCFEFIEHVADPAPILRCAARLAPILLASVPNEDVFPFKNYAFHHRHYRPGEFLDLLHAAGYGLESWWGQVGPESEVEHAVSGRTLIAVARRGAATITSLGLTKPAPVDAGPDPSAYGPAPDHVAIVGNGPSATQFFEIARGLGGASAYCDEVWGVNPIGDVLRCSRVFHMDDLRIQEERAKLNPDSGVAAMVRWLKTHPGPVYTSVVRPGYPGLVAFPLEAFLKRRHDGNGSAPYFNTTTAYAIAFAIHIRVKRISLFGIDYTMANRHAAEQGRACCEFWLGVAAARGIEITVSDQSSLLDACATDRDRLYGYDCVDVQLEERDDGTFDLRMTDRADIPTAAEIEARYDQKNHPNPLMRSRQP
jgi:SAM-dependent methyltransferase